MLQHHSPQPPPGTKQSKPAGHAGVQHVKFYHQQANVWLSLFRPTNTMHAWTHASTKFFYLPFFVHIYSTLTYLCQSKLCLTDLIDMVHRDITCWWTAHAGRNLISGWTNDLVDVPLDPLPHTAIETRPEKITAGTSWSIKDLEG
jgi:hypothetical protein